MSQELFDQLCFYTLGHGDPQFLHQHAVDAYAVQTTTTQTRPIATVFGLAGLYLHLERGFTGREVQLAHMKMARRRTAWPSIQLPDDRGGITIAEIVKIPAGEPLDAAIEAWCSSVWQAVHCTRTETQALLEELGVVEAIAT